MKKQIACIIRILIIPIIYPIIKIKSYVKRLSIEKKNLEFHKQFDLIKSIASSDEEKDKLLARFFEIKFYEMHPVLLKENSLIKGNVNNGNI